ncbi:MAG TPA: glycosyltransferase [Victivallales bacterium]|nr:glycosyltransferase [Victivallales bacterium]
MNSRKITVIIPTYNCSRLLNCTLISLLNQSLDSSIFEVIVIDDGGNDDTENIVNSYKDLMNIRYYWYENKGFRAGKARNVGATLAETKYILFLDSGILASDKLLETHIKMHEQAASSTVVIGYTYAFDITNDEVKILLPQLISDDADACIEIAKRLKMYDIRQYQYDLLGTDIYNWPAPFYIFWTCHTSVEYKELVKAGLFAAEYDGCWVGEDIDLGIRLFNNNNIFLLNDTAPSFHWPHKKNISNDKKRASGLMSYINKKYSLWQTANHYLLMDPEVGHKNLSMNTALKTLSYPFDKKSLEDFVKKNKYELENKLQLTIK